MRVTSSTSHQSKMSNANPPGTPRISPKPTEANQRKLGGAALHKNPFCSCVACSARRRKEKAQLIATGGESSSEAPIASESFGLTQEQVESRMAKVRMNADLPDRRILTASTDNLRTAHDRVRHWIRLRNLEPNLTNKEIAERQGISVGHLNSLITKARKEGWLVFEDPLAQIEYELIPKTVDNLNHFLDAKDKLVTIEVAKGTIFKQYQAAKGIQEMPSTILALKIEQPTPGGEVKVMTGQIVGKPRGLTD